MSDLTSVVVLAIGAVVAILLFLLFRAVVLWYWKIDKIVELLEQLVRLNASNANSKALPVEEQNLPEAGSIRHLTKSEFDSLTLPQQVVVMDYGYLLSPEDARTVGGMLGNFQSSSARSFASQNGKRVTYSN